MSASDRPSRPLASIALTIAVLALGTVLFEIFLRTFMPLPAQGGIYLDDHGRPIRIAASPVLLQPGIHATHISGEFSKSITINRLGYRTSPGDDSTEPDFVFLGDSFTFGHGVSDKEAGVFIFCAERKARCQNLGRSGTDTFDQIDVLQYALEARQFRPKVVVLVMFASCWLGGSGNDLAGNLTHAKRTTAAGSAQLASSLPLNEIAKRIQASFGTLEVTKRVMMVLAGPIKTGLFACSPASDLSAAGRATQRALEQLETLAKRGAFAVKVVSLHPYQELDGHFTTTEALLRSIMPPSFSYTPTAARFRREHYYPYDGHLNVAGQANLAALLNDAL